MLQPWLYCDPAVAASGPLSEYVATAVDEGLASWAASASGYRLLTAPFWKLGKASLPPIACTPEA